jgi:protoheme IX farnesyltransferase
LAAPGAVESPLRLLLAIIATSLVVAGANALNMVLERDSDRLMERTRNRPLPLGRLTPEVALAFGIGTGWVGLLLLGLYINATAAALAALALVSYVLVYTPLKRVTPFALHIGAIPGALPPVIGWAAVTGEVGIPALILFALVFYWTPPHFWALSLRIRKDYAAAGVPMLPVVRGIPETTRQIGLYTILMVAISLVLWPVAQMGLIYLGAAVGLGAVFIWQAWALWRRGASEEASTAGAIALYRYSISYLSLLFVAIAVDALVLTV